MLAEGPFRNGELQNRYLQGLLHDECPMITFDQGSILTTGFPGPPVHGWAQPSRCCTGQTSCAVLVLWVPASLMARLSSDRGISFLMVLRPTRAVSGMKREMLIDGSCRNMQHEHCGEGMGSVGGRRSVHA